MTEGIGMKVIRFYIYFNTNATNMKLITKLTIEQKLQGIIIAAIGFAALINYMILA